MDYNYLLRLKKAAEEGILILVKFGFIIAAVVYTFALLNQTREYAVNGNAAANAILQFQNKGWLPQFQNGQVPDKPKTE